LGLAEAMDTAQRGMGVDWATALELIQRTMEAARAHPLKPRVACGAGTDHKAPGDLADADAIIAAYAEQMEAIEAAGGQIILMATRALPAIGADAETYGRVYDTLLSQAAEPVILHWLGEMFDPALADTGAPRDVAAASDVVLGLIERARQRSTGSRSRSSTRPMKRRFARACRTACGSIPGTISTMRR
jgi:hypothetical protein